MLKQLVKPVLFLALVLIYDSKGEENTEDDLQKNLVLKTLQPPPITVPEDINKDANVRKKRCGGGGGGCCGGCSQSKTYNVQITVKKTQARHPPPRMVHRPAAVAVIPVAVVPVQTYTVARPAPVCCGGGGYGGGGGGGKKWKGK